MIRIVMVVIFLIVLSFIINSFSDLEDVIMSKVLSLGIVGVLLIIPLGILGIVLLGIVIYRYFLPLTDKLFERINKEEENKNTQP